jgi:hypothetical protein
MKLKNLKYRFPIYGNKTLKIAFEFGVVLSEVAKEKEIKLTPEISERAEKILINELNTKGLNATALNFIPLILAALEV